MKKYRYRKVNPEILSQMKQLKESGLTYQAIAEKFNIGSSTAQYWLSPQEKENSIKRSKKSYAKLTPEQRKETYKKHYKYQKEYYVERYNSDEEFRKRHIKSITNSFAKRREVWREQNLCSQCGRDKIEKKWKTCEKCRKKWRKKHG